MVDKKHVTDADTDLVTALKALEIHPGWKYLMTSFETIRDLLVKNIITPRTNQSLIFNADHIMKERLEVINLILEAPKMEIKKLENKIFALKENAKTTEDKLAEYNKSFNDGLEERGL